MPLVPVTFPFAMKDPPPPPPPLPEPPAQPARAIQDESVATANAVLIQRLSEPDAHSRTNNRPTEIKRTKVIMPAAGAVTAGPFRQ